MPLIETRPTHSASLIRKKYLLSFVLHCKVTAAGYMVACKLASAESAAELFWFHGGFLFGFLDLY